QVSGWLDAWTPAPSAYAVRARHAADVAAAVNFARDHRLRLVVKGGGHSYLGTSSAPDSLLIWTRAMNEVVLHDAFVGQGCQGAVEPAAAVSTGAGALWIDLYHAVTTNGGRYVQGGGCTDVGVAGLVQSGGFGSLSKAFGTAAASLLEAEVVTADGQLRIANPRTNPDLFWALRGGGGGSWGVVTRLTLRTHSLPQHFGAAWGKVQARSDAAYQRLIARFFAFYSATLFNPQWGEQVSFAPDNTLKISMVCQGLDKEQVRALWQPFFAWLQGAPEDYRVVDALGGGAMEARDWWSADKHHSLVRDLRAGAPAHHAWWDGDQDQVGAYLHGYDSLWLPAALLREEGGRRLAEAVFAASRHKELGFHMNKGLAGAPAPALAAARDTATNPAVLEAFALVIIADGEGPAYPGLPRAAVNRELARKDARAIDRATAELRRLAPGAGSYVSESNYFNAAWQRAYWGEHYARLRAIKDRYDPGGLFFVHHGVGSEDWSPDGFTQLR
ncbi:MAG TPA: FAD-binding oxidoreductase, partial [Steroidobacteraceae bacterium]|nr:FAD-binding oxidoreductase [Steroidobacteraceae bacterium]